MNRAAWTSVCAAFVVALSACGASAQDAETEPAPQAQEAETQEADTQEADTQETSEEEQSVASAAEGVYTQEQADRGEQVFQETCSYCHAESEFSGGSFMRSWEGAAVGQFYGLIRATMPYDGPGSLPAQQYADVTAYILSLNGLPAGDVELPTDAEALEEIPIESPSRSD